MSSRVVPFSKFLKQQAKVNIDFMLCIDFSSRVYLHQIK